MLKDNLTVLTFTLTDYNIVWSPICLFNMYNDKNKYPTDNIIKNIL